MTGLSDCCPACLDPVPVVPHRLVAQSRASVRADYRCDCGHSWFTCWNPVALAALEAS